MASTYHIITSSCRAADWSTAKPLPMRVPCPPTVRHLPRLLYLPYTCPAPFSPDHPSLPSSLHHPSIPPSFSADLPISEVTRTGPADGSSSAVSAASVAASVLHVVQSRSRFFICFCFSPEIVFICCLSTRILSQIHRTFDTFVNIFHNCADLSTIFFLLRFVFTLIPISLHAQFLCYLKGGKRFTSEKTRINSFTYSKQSICYP